MLPLMKRKGLKGVSTKTRSVRNEAENRVKKGASHIGPMLYRNASRTDKKFGIVLNMAISKPTKNINGSPYPENDMRPREGATGFNMAADELLVANLTEDES